MFNACVDWDATLAGLWEALQTKTRDLTVGQLQEQAGDATAASCNLQVTTNHPLPTCSSQAAPCLVSRLLAVVTGHLYGRFVPLVRLSCAASPLWFTFSISA